MRTQRTTVTAITAARVLCAAIIVYCVRRHYWQFALLVAIIGFITDYLDGKLARQWQVTSPFGAFFDPLADKILTLTLTWLFVFYFHYGLLFVIFAVIFTVYDITTTLLRSLHFTGKSIKTSHVAKAKTATLMLGLLLVLLCSAISGTWLHEFVKVFGEVLLSLAALLSLISLKHYLKPSRTVIEQYTQLHDIDFVGWHAEGITCVLFDVDGTLTAWKDKNVSRQIQDTISTARDAGITHIGLVSNMSPKRVAQLQSVATQVGADAYQLSANATKRKPNPHMVHTTLHELEVPAKNTAFVGDKVVDVIAANRAGLQRVAWVDRLGKEDHLFDKFIYRRIEPLIKWLMR